ncbi:MAG: (d)CMP kinase [Alphaproteobacteria bacterium]|jgi:cytidylate kinase|nr:(d)CMP kinase [Alphaproteobacteria bacterium]
MIIAVDGPVAAGKGTLARRLAAHFGFAYLDTGSLYRAAALRLLRQGGDPSDAAVAAAAAKALTAAELDDPALRNEAVGEAASQISPYPEVRAALLEYQRRFAAEPPRGAAGAVLDGRDVGTVVCPDAEVKLFVTASDEARARRRHLELEARGGSPGYDEVLEDLRRRDRRDRTRANSPLVRAPDADLLETTDLGIEAAFQAALRLIAAR